MVQYKLLYIPGRGLGEIIRQLFVVAGKDYEDKRITFEEWPKYKENTPFGHIPVLEVDGKQLAQSHAIARYLARQFGFAGKNAWEEALVDSIASQYKDYLEEVRPFFRVVVGYEDGDPEVLGKDVFLPANKKFFAFITKFLKDNKSGYLVGDSLTWVDLLVAESATFTDKFPTLYDGFSEVKAHAEKIRSIPELKKWIETRPDSDY